MRKVKMRTTYVLPRGVSPLEHAAYQASKLTPREWNTQIIPVHTAIDALCRGEWSKENWQPVFEALKRIESMLRRKPQLGQGFIPEARGTIEEAMNRHANTGVCAFRAPEMAIIREIGRIYGQLLMEITHKDFQAACAHTNANMARIVGTRREAVAA